MTKQTTRKFGAHVSSAGGVHKAVERVKAIGGNCVQVFSGSPRSWGRSPLEKIDLKQLTKVQAELGVAPIFTHSLYLLNLASENPDLLQKSTQALVYDLHFDALVQGGGVIVHLGSHLGRGWEACVEEVAERISQILEQSPGNSRFLIENSAGQQGKLCSDLADIQQILDLVNSPRLGWCLDTCHAWAAGYTFGETGAKNPELRGNLASSINQYHLREALSCIHVNDSRDPFGSGRDRHENLGDGTIPNQELRQFLTSEQFADLPLITEVPGLDKQGPDLENMKRLHVLGGA